MKNPRAGMSGESAGTTVSSFGAEGGSSGGSDCGGDVVDAQDDRSSRAAMIAGTIVYPVSAVLILYSRVIAFTEWMISS